MVISYSKALQKFVNKNWKEKVNCYLIQMVINKKTSKENEKTKNEGLNDLKKMKEKIEEFK